MLTKRIIPCLDCKDGRVVKGVQFKDLVDAGDPTALAKRYEQMGADELVFLDISATLEKRQNQLSTVKAVRSVLSIPLTVGGGVRSLSDIEALLAAGADKIAINSAGIKSPEIIDKASSRFGSQCIVVSVDVTNVGAAWRVLSRSGTVQHSLEALLWIKEVIQRGAGEILLTSLDRDGTQKGYDTELLSIVAKESSVPIIASGGAKGVKDFIEAFNAGADAVLAASMFHFNSFSVQEVKQTLRSSGIEVRL